MWFYVACFGVRVSVLFHLMFVHYSFSSILAVEWPPFGNKLPIRLAICSHFLLSIIDFYLFPMLVLRAKYGSSSCSMLFYYFIIVRPKELFH